MSATEREAWRLLRVPGHGWNSPSQGVVNYARTGSTFNPWTVGEDGAATFTCTVELLESPTGTRYPQVWRRNSDNFVRLEVNTARQLRVRTEVAGVIVSTAYSPTLTVGSSYKCAIRVTPATTEFWFDGSLVGSVANPATATNTLGAGHLWMNSFSGSAGHSGPFNLDDFRCYNRALTDEELADWFAFESSPEAASDLMLWWPVTFGDSAASGLADFSGNNRPASFTSVTDAEVQDAAGFGGDPETDLFDIETTEAVNRYASNYIPHLDDHGGDKSTLYPRGQRALAQYSVDDGASFQTKQAGFVQNPIDGGRQGQFRALFIGYDYFLRSRPVFETFAGVTVESALQTLITENTNVNWNPAKVDVQNNDTFSREFKGQKADEVASFLSSLSQGEEYGVDDELDFFFRPEQVEAAPSDILNGDWWDYDLPVEGRHAVNQVRVFYGESGSRSSVVVEDRVKQRNLREQLDAPRRVVLSYEVAYPEIDNESAAFEKGKELLEQRTPVLTGTVGTFQRFDWEPGDVFTLEVPEKNLLDSFRAAEVQHTWSRSETTVKVAQNTGNITDMLKQMSDDIVRIDLRDADPDAPFTRFLELGLGVTMNASAYVEQRTQATTAFTAGFTQDRAGLTRTEAGEPQAGFDYASITRTPAATGTVTRAAQRQMREAWQDDAPPDAIEYLGVGTGTSAATVTNSQLGNQRTRIPVEQVYSTGRYTASFEGVLDAGGPHAGTAFREWGFFEQASGGEMHNRATVGGVTHGADTETRFYFEFRLRNDSTERVGVVTNTGQERARDMYLAPSQADPTRSVDVTDVHPDDRAWGTDDGSILPEAVANTALGAKVGEKPNTGFRDAAENTTDVVMRILDADYAGEVGELGDENDLNELLTRATFEQIDMATATFDLETNLQVRFRAVSV